MTVSWGHEWVAKGIGHPSHMFEVDYCTVIQWFTFSSRSEGAIIPTAN